MCKSILTTQSQIKKKALAYCNWLYYEFIPETNEMSINRKESYVLFKYSTCIDIHQEGLNIKDSDLNSLKKMQGKKALKFFLFWGTSESHGYKGCLKLSRESKTRLCLR